MTPAEYLRDLRDRYSRPVEGDEPDESYLNAHLDQLAVQGTSDVQPAEFFDGYFGEKVARIAGLLKPAVREEVLTRISTGTLEHPGALAAIYGHPKASVFAIVVHRGFISLLNHYLKLVIAANHPDEVTHYQGISVKGLGRTTYSQAAQRMLAEYRRTRQARGPQLKLRIGGQALPRVNLRLALIYQFVVAHEIGHYVNGDFANRASLAVIGDGRMLAIPKDGDHRREFLADRFAFSCVLRGMAQDAPDQPAWLALRTSVVLFFNFYREISDAATDSHPPPSVRMLMIVQDFFGEKPRDLMQASFDDVNQLRTFEAHIEGVTIGQLSAKIAHPAFAI